MKNLKDMCLIEKSVLQDFMKAAGVNDDTYIRGEQKLRQALNQDLSGMVVVPLTPTKDMLEAMDEAGMMDSSYYPDVYKAVLSAAQKEKNDD